MSWDDVAAAAAADIHAEFTNAIITIEPKLTAPLVDIPAIKVEFPGDDPFADGMSVRQRGYEVRKSDVPDKPANGWVIVDGTARHSIIEVRNQADTGSWVLMVEAASS